jgi:hypothetical protein
MKELLIGLFIFSFLLLPCLEDLASPTNEIGVEWNFWREKIDPLTGEGEIWEEYSLKDKMNNIIWIENKGEVPITKIKVEFLTILKNYSVIGLLRILTPLVPSEVKWERSWGINLKPGDEKQLEEIKEFSEWVKQDFEALGYEITKMDKDKAIIEVKGKWGPIPIKVNVDLANSKGETTVEMFIDSEYFGKRENSFVIIRAT